jgi:hypothetical protein
MFAPRRGCAVGMTEMGELKMAPGFDKELAVEYGILINLAYAMYGRTNVENPYMPSYEGLPDAYEFAAWVRMTDFTPKGVLVPKFYGIIVQKKANPNNFVLAIRGTESDTINEWWDNFTSVDPVEMGGFTGKVGNGFGRIFGSMTVTGLDGNPTDEYGTGFVQQVAAAATRKLLGVKVAQANTEHLQAQSQISIEVVGHSLGGALATLYVAKNASDKQLRVSRIYTFASPFVGDSKFARSFDSLGIDSFRIANFFDVVPHLPPNLEFRHVGSPEAINSGIRVHADPVCWHSMQTYLNAIDPNIPIDESCNPNPPDFHPIAGH